MSKNEIVIITGAAKGLGYELAKLSSTEYQKLILIDIDEHSLIEASKTLKTDQNSIETYTVDLSEPEAIEKFLNESNEPIDLLINNAGYVSGGKFENISRSDHIKTIQTNQIAPMLLCHEYISRSKKQHRDLKIINIASASAFIGFPEASSYASSKWGLLGLSETIDEESFKDSSSSHVQVTVACPSYIQTKLFKGAQPPRFQKMLEPKSLALKIWKASKKNKFLVCAPWFVSWTPLIKAILPRLLWRQFFRLMKVHQGMKTWSGNRA